MKRFDNPDVIIADVMDSHGKWRVNTNCRLLTNYMWVVGVQVLEFFEYVRLGLNAECTNMRMF